MTPCRILLIAMTHWSCYQDNRRAPCLVPLGPKYLRGSCEPWRQSDGGAKQLLVTYLVACHLHWRSDSVLHAAPHTELRPGSFSTPVLQPLLAQTDQEKQWLTWVILFPQKAPPLLPELLQKMANICPSLSGALEVLEQEDAAFLFSSSMKSHIHILSKALV